MNRREFLLSAAAGATVAAFPLRSLADAKSVVEAQLTLLPNQRGATLDKEFIGLSYETAQLAHPEYFSGQNTELIAYVRGLAPHGVLRIGGNTSEFATWTPNPMPRKPSEESGAVGPDKGRKPAPPTQTTPLAIRNLRDFLDATGWRAYYGLNLGQGTPQLAAEEAAYVADTLGDRLILFQIGNESDLFHHNGLRSSNYDYAAFAKDWQSFHDAVHAKVPTAKFAGPDTAGTSAFIVEFAEQFRNQVELLTTHYYAEGPPTDPSMTIERLLAPNPRLESAIPLIRQAMESSHLPYRLSETNSCYQGGKEGVSNTFASSLWAADLMLQIAAFGASGINFHGGGYGWYAPIVGTIPNGFVARPEYYGILMVSQMVGGRLIDSKLQTPADSPLLKAYAAQAANGSMQAAIINKNPEQRVRLTVQAGSNAGRIAVQRLVAPRLQDTADVTFAGAPVGADGAWKPERIEYINSSNGIAECWIPAGSAALLTWG